MTASTRSIRPAQPPDLDAIRELLRACDLPQEDLTADHLAHFFVCTDGAALRGVVGLEPTEEGALLRSLAVPPEGRGEGIGTRLIEAIERYAVQAGIGRVYLLTTTAADYFEAHGYDRVDRTALPPSIQETEEAARLCPDSAVCMRKRLSVSNE
jgi:amino-acid N-acetyltransferase